MEAKHYFTPATYFEHLRREPIRFGMQIIVPSILFAHTFAFDFFSFCMLKGLLFFFSLVLQNFSFLFFFFFFSSKLNARNLMLGT